MKSFFQNKKIVLTGAAAGLGRELALQLSELGAQLYLVDVNKEGLNEIREKCGDSVLETFPCDLSLPIGFSEIGHRLAETTQIDIVIANAGVGGINPATAFSFEIHQKIMAINYNGLVSTIEPFLSSMIQNKSGLIIGVSSLAGLRGLPMASSYSSSKAAVNTFLESLRVDLAPHGVSVCTVCPGFLETKMADHKEFDTPFKVSPQNAAKKILIAVSKRKKVFLFPLPMKLASLLNRLLPIFAYDLIAKLILRSDSSKRAQIF